MGGIVTLESTAEGRHGYFYEFSQIAQKLSLMDKKLTTQDWRFFFFAWWQNKEYAMTTEPISERLQTYFDSLKAKYDISLSDEQKAWYQAKERTLGDDMKREYRHYQ